MAKKTKSKDDEEEKVGFWSSVFSFIVSIDIVWLISFSMFISFVIFMYFIHTNVSNDPKFIYNKSSLVLKNEIPRWIVDNNLTSKVQLNTKDVMKTYRGKSFFDEDTLGKLHTALMKTNWVKEVSLEKSFPSKIEMVIEFRKPIVAFLNKENWYTLDFEGHFVPIIERKGSENLDLVRFIDVPEDKQSFKPGELINNPSVIKAIQLTNLITNRVATPGKLLRVIFLSEKNNDNEDRFKLIFQNGLEVVWGNFLQENEIERFPEKYLNSEEKLAILFTSLNKNPNQLHVNVEFSR